MMMYICRWGYTRRLRRMQHVVCDKSPVVSYAIAAIPVVCDLSLGFIFTRHLSHIKSKENWRFQGYQYSVVWYFLENLQKTACARARTLFYKCSAAQHGGLDCGDSGRVDFPLWRETLPLQYEEQGILQQRFEKQGFPGDCCYPRILRYT